LFRPHGPASSASFEECTFVTDRLVYCGFNEVVGLRAAVVRIVTLAAYARALR
jgi:hypothetical protein